MYKRIIYMLLGINIFALNLNLLKSFDLGMGSFDTMTMYIQQLLNIKLFGNASFLLHMFFAITLIILSKKYELKYKTIILSIISIFLLTRVVNIYSLLNIKLTKNLINFIIVFLLLNLGLYFIMKSNMIIAPFDKFIVETAKYKKVLLSNIRLKGDISLLIIVIIGVLLTPIKVPITIFTFIITFLTGANIYLYEMLFNKLTKRYS